MTLGVGEVEEYGRFVDVGHGDDYGVGCLWARKGKREWSRKVLRVVDGMVE